MALQVILALKITKYYVITIQQQQQQNPVFTIERQNNISTFCIQSNPLTRQRWILTHMKQQTVSFVFQFVLTVWVFLLVTYKEGLTEVLLTMIVKKEGTT